MTLSSYDVSYLSPSGGRSGISATVARSRLKALTIASTLMFSVSAMAAQSTAGVPTNAVGQGADKPITIALFLPSRDPKGAQDFVAHVSKPGDPLFHHYLLPSEYAARFGASQADYDAVAAWATAQGLKVGERFTARTVMPVTGSAATLGAALGVSFKYRNDPNGRVFYSTEAAPVLPEAISKKIAGVVGLSSSIQYAPMFRRLPANQRSQASGTGPLGAFSASDLRSIYLIPHLDFGAGTQVLAVFEQGGFDPNDVATYVAANKLPSVPVTARSVDHYGNGIDDPRVELEAVLDIDMQLAMNPVAKRIVVYEDGTDSFQVALLDSFSAMASDHIAKSISVSYGTDEADQGGDAIAAENTVLTQLAAQGQAVFASSGDDGAYGPSTGDRPTRNVSDPASQPMVTAVGGTTLFDDASQSYEGEDAWNELGLQRGATGGGISQVWPIPPYQDINGTSVARRNGGSSKFRNVPDVASVGDPLTGVAVYSQINGGWIVIGGTSVSAPIWAGFYSVICTVSEGFGFGVPGFANPALYAAVRSVPLIAPVFHDVIDGSNGNKSIFRIGGFNAGLGYDNTTGLGSFAGELLLSQFLILPVSGDSDPPPAPTDLTVTATATKATLRWSGTVADRGFIVFLATKSPISLSPAAFVALVPVKEGQETVTNLSPNTEYYYQIVAVSSGGYAISSPAIFATLTK